ncbi:MAG TPA: ABC transporter ATP-binding protein [Stellaceae bacterium]|nr:ABC transporter ATP-binding protein [Stellaceae bacterium]
MARIELQGISVTLPIYDAQTRSLKSTIAAIGTGGRLVRGAAERVVVSALDDISVTFEHGDRVALIGHNGAGKTTLLRVLAGTYQPARGRMIREGRATAFFDISAGMEMEATGYENIVIRSLYMGMTLREIRGVFDKVAEFTELGSYLAMPIRTYSLGMMLRLAFSISTSVKPEILLMDEWLSVGDAGFTEKAKQRIDEIIDGSSIMVLASHDLKLIRRICNKALLLSHGQMLAFGSTGEVIMASEAMVS